jgi:hypothetical protein
MTNTETGETRSGETHNLITQVGMQSLVERGFGILTLPIPVGMKLGTGSTAPAATGTGAALVTYLTASNLVFDGTYPQSAMNGLYRRITVKCTYAPGVATTATPITEVVIFSNANANATSTAAQTISRAIIAPGAKAAADQLSITWNLDFLPG